MLPAVLSYANGRGRASGYLLLEVLITLSVSLLALTALVKFQGELFRSDLAARARIHAAFLAEQRLEHLFVTIRSEGLEAAPGGTDALDAELALAAPAEAARYTRSWSVDADPEAGTAQLEVTVSWADLADNLHEITLASCADTAVAAYAAPVLAHRDYILLPQP